MALGKNLKKRKLISSEAQKPAPKKKTKKVVSKKKELIEKPKPKAKKPAPKKPQSKVVKKEEVIKEVEVVKEREAPIQSYDPVISHYIVNELHERKSQLRKQYKEEIASIQAQTLQFVSFEIGGERYAMEIDHVKEIVQLPTLSRTPNTPPHIKGIANVRGNTYVVFDLAARFHVEESKEAQYLLIINHNEVKASLILPLLPTTFKKEGKFISSEMNMIEDASLDISYIKGIIQDNEDLIYYLDIIEMLKRDKAVVIPDKIAKQEK